MQETNNIEELMAVSKPGGAVSSQNSLIEDIHSSLLDMAAATENANEAKSELDRLIAEKLHDGADPFVAMMDAMLYVVPQLMKYKEEKLVEKTASFEYINSLNAYMAETQKNFSRSANAGEASANGNYSSGNTSYEKDGEVHGLNAGKNYQTNLNMILSEDLLAGLPADIQDVMNGSIGITLGLKGKTPEAGKWTGLMSKTEYSMPEVLWGGLNASQWRMEGDGTYSNNLYSTSNEKQNSFNYFGDPKDPYGKSEAGYVADKLLPVVDEAVTQNTVMETTLNGYSKKVESEFKFEMENYNSIVSLNGLMYQDQINLNETHISRLRTR